MRSVLTAAALAMLLVSPVSVSARTLHVSPAPLARIAVDQQFRTISAAAAQVKPGDTVSIHTGVYRELVTIAASGTPQQPITFQPAQGARVVVTGADQLVGAVKEAGADPVYSAPWPYDFIKSDTHTHGADAPIGRCEQVFVHGYPLAQVLSRDRLSPGTFFADLQNKRLYMWASDGANLAGLVPEASTRKAIWNCSGQYVKTRGIIFRYAANQAQQGATVFTGQYDLIEDCVFERTNGIGAAFWAPDMRIRRCVFQDNGQMGFSAGRAHRTVMTGCVIRNNNVKNFDRKWEAGGNKIVHTRGLVIENSVIEGNRGHGIWFDIGNEHCIVRNCLIKGNEDSGLFYEISYGLQAHDNVVIGNGYGIPPNSWGEGGGISFYASPGCVIERNILAGNVEGINFRERGHRTTSRFEDNAAKENPIWSHDETVRNNLIANNGVGTWGWFYVDDNRFLPKAMQEKPSDWSLEKLKFDIRNNLYCVGPDQRLFIWTVGFPPYLEYNDLGKVSKQLRFEIGSRVESIKFRDFISGDLRLPANSLAFEMGCYPRGSVPGVKLGVMGR